LHDVMWGGEARGRAPARSTSPHQIAQAHEQHHATASGTFNQVLPPSQGASHTVALPPSVSVLSLRAGARILAPARRSRGSY
jgi:hypothetical protein